MEGEGGARIKTLPEFPFVTGALLLLGSSAGGGILVWWFLSFHGDNERLWMVPLGLVIFFAPLLACFSISFSAVSCCRIVSSSAAVPLPLPPQPADPERGHAGAGTRDRLVWEQGAGLLEVE